jgi:hypothetical protein
MAHGIQDTSHVWLVMLKAMRALTRYAAAGIEGTGLGDSDFRVLEVLLHKGPLVNTIGPIVDLTLFRFSWKWRRRSPTKLMERTHEEATEALHAGRKDRHPQATFAGEGDHLEAVR